MKRVRAYKTDDDEIFLNREVAQHHETALALSKFLEEKGVGFAAGREWDTAMICEFLLENATEIREILLNLHAKETLAEDEVTGV